ncbi:hypothetical protein [Nonomuraea sp. NEAU-A123]|uniref:hypothetical protein n=1 Tax=Nonomuraea sp. NEAU-A123 TaxID=2839649 RepID=UPI001BE3D0DA|nr:hypothetical protein [Nonomuraea sp. NEAU-A123]MBT2231310.1 hypothetical protein [Nonomuraea sp. NEAU-A123]
MKLVTTPTRPMLAVRIGLAAVSAIALLGLPTAPGLLDPPDLRLTAAVTTPAEGAYWHTRTLSKNTYPWQLGSGSNRYWVETQVIRELWISTAGKYWFGERTLGTHPRSAADQKAWHRDGSPAKWSRTADGRKAGSMSTKTEKGSVELLKGTNEFFLAGQKLTYEEVQQLPADPSGLKAWLAKAARVSRTPENAVDGHVTASLPLLLYSLPAPKEVRAAAYQALLTMPGVRSLGKVKDHAGRTGAGLSINTTTELIVDTDKMVLLARIVGTKPNGKPSPNKALTETLLQVGWTDAAPSVPALP